MHRRFCSPITVHLLLIRGDEILLLKRKNTGFGDGQYSVVAGCCDGGESVTTAMVREAAEEAGIEVRADDLHVAAVLHGRRGPEWESVEFFFFARQFRGEITNREPDKCDELAFFPLAALPDTLLPNVRLGLSNALEGIFFGEYGWSS